MSTKSSQTNQEMRLTEKSHMLDEVNKLLDMMVVEKQCLHQRIADLELQLHSPTSDTTSTTTRHTVVPTEKVEKIIQTEISYEKEFSNSIPRIRKMIMKEREELKQMGIRQDEMTRYCKKERSLLRAEVDKTHNLLERSEMNTRKQIREGKTLESKLTEAVKTQNQLKDSNIKLTQSLEDMKLKYMRTRTSLLAMKGRNLMETKKAYKVEEDKHMRELTNDLQKEQEGKSRLQQTLQNKEKEISILSMQLTKKQDELLNLGRKYDELRQGVEKKLNNLGQQLALSRDELIRVGDMLKIKQEQLVKCQHLLKEEREKSAECQSKNCLTVTQLTAQLEKERRHHEQQIHELNLRITKLKTQHVIEMERMKDVTSQRCKELAHEVWTLRKK